MELALTRPFDRGDPRTAAGCCAAPSQSVRLIQYLMRKVSNGIQLVDVCRGSTSMKETSMPQRRATDCTAGSTQHMT